MIDEFYQVGFIVLQPQQIRQFLLKLKLFSLFHHAHYLVLFINLHERNEFFFYFWVFSLKSGHFLSEIGKLIFACKTKVVIPSLHLQNEALFVESQAVFFLSEVIELFVQPRIRQATRSWCWWFARTCFSRPDLVWAFNWWFIRCMLGLRPFSLLGDNQDLWCILISVKVGSLVRTNRVIVRLLGRRNHLAWPQAFNWELALLKRSLRNTWGFVYNLHLSMNIPS